MDAFGFTERQLAALAVLTAASALSTWLLTGFPREEACRVGRAAWALLRREAALACRIFHGAARRLGLGEDSGPAVTLGDVSEMVDIVRLGLTAGLSFDAALGLYCEGCSGALPERLARARLSWQTGAGGREEELLRAAGNLGVRALESFAVAVGQALELGAPLADTLRDQGREIRAAHRAEVERQIERAPVKMLIPTGTLILPALLLSILGPLLAAGGMI